MLETLKLSDFRCFEQLQLAFEPGITAFLGDNAQGKTSILEAVCVLLRLQSPRTVTWSDMLRFERPGFGLAGRWNGRDLQVVYQPRRRRKLYYHGEEIRRTRHYLEAGGLVVWMGNDDLGLVSGSAAKRRRYLDFLASQRFVGYRTALRDYERALRARNRLLKLAQRPPDHRRQIAAYAKVLAAHGTHLTARRAELVKELDPNFSAVQARIGSRRERLTLSYLPSPPDGALEQALAGAEEADLRRGQTTIGPHRDDLEIRIDGRPAAKFASEGQQRTIALALKLAQVDCLRPVRPDLPVLLVDDVFGELDPQRRHALFDALPPHGAATGTQILLTTTSLDGVPEIRRAASRIHRIEAGRVLDLA